MIELKEVLTPNDLDAFIDFPFKLYKNNKYWVPPIKADERTNFDKTINPIYKNAEANLFLALKDGKIAGRIAIIINWQEVNDQKIKKIRFGWFDTEDDLNITRALINKVAEIGKSHNLEFMEGPIGFSNMDKVGVLTEGFDQVGTMSTWYNHPYYQSHFEQLGMEIEKSTKRYDFQAVAT